MHGNLSFSSCNFRLSSIISREEKTIAENTIYSLLDELKSCPGEYKGEKHLELMLLEAE